VVPLAVVGPGAGWAGRGLGGCGGDDLHLEGSSGWVEDQAEAMGPRAEEGDGCAAAQGGEVAGPKAERGIVADIVRGVLAQVYKTVGQVEAAADAAGGIAGTVGTGDRVAAAGLDAAGVDQVSVVPIEGPIADGIADQVRRSACRSHERSVRWAGWLIPITPPNQATRDGPEHLVA